MTRYERRILTLGESNGVDVEGRIIAVLDSPKAGRNQITALVEVGEEVPPATFEDESEGVTDEELAAAYKGAAERDRAAEFPPKSTFFCGAEKGDGDPCEREVDEPDETCWQHPDESNRN
jgi:hypothetical protein